MIQKEMTEILRKKYQKSATIFVKIYRINKKGLRKWRVCDIVNLN